MCKVLVTGSRSWVDIAAFVKALGYIEQHHGPISLLIQGGARGADRVAHQSRGRIPCATFRAQWDKYGKQAGPIRNRLMFDTSKPDLVAAFPLPDSVGTLDMMAYAKAQGCSVLNFGCPYPDWPTVTEQSQQDEGERT